MPYEIMFTKPLAGLNPADYINECCYGGDVVAGQLLTALKARYPDCKGAGQEDWGWFIWFRDGDVFLAVDIYCEDAANGTFKVHLTSRKKRWLRRASIVDTPELEELKNIVIERLRQWVGAAPAVEILNNRYMPKGV